MTGITSEAGRGAGAVTAIAGSATLLPNTGSNLAVTVTLYVVIAAAAGIITSTIARKLLARR